jgi:hypothetical protein
MPHHHWKYSMRAILFLQLTLLLNTAALSFAKRHIAD